MAGTIDESAQRIAKRGREALLERLREAFAQAAAAHADVLELDENKLEQMVQRAADRADGLQWRRALASVATDELGIGLGEALGHPAVARAQAIIGAPSYEEGLAAIAEGQPPAPGSVTRDTADGETAGPADGHTAGPADGATAENAEAEAAPPEDGAPPPPPPETEDEPGGLQIRVAVIHLDGMPELEARGELELLFSEAGLEVVRAGDHEALTTFTWTELRDVEVGPGRGRVFRRRSSRVVLRASGRSGRFEARGVDPAELKQRLAPALAKLGGGG